MDYKHVQEFLNKFKKITDSFLLNKDKVVLVLEKNLKLKIEKDSFSVKNKVLQIKASPVIRNEIFLRKESIIKDLNDIGIEVDSIR
jgi:hypothetical protein